MAPGPVGRIGAVFTVMAPGPVGRIGAVFTQPPARGATPTQPASSSIRRRGPCCVASRRWRQTRVRGHPRSPYRSVPGTVQGSTRRDGHGYLWTGVNPQPDTGPTDRRLLGLRTFLRTESSSIRSPRCTAMPLRLTRESLWDLANRIGSAPGAKAGQADQNQFRSHHYHLVQRRRGLSVFISFTF